MIVTMYLRIEMVRYIFFANRLTFIRVRVSIFSVLSYCVIE